MSYPAKMEDGVLKVKVGSRWRRGEETTCEGCGFVFYRPLGLREGEGKFCTPGCAVKHRRTVGIKYAKFCVICNDKYQVKPSHFGRHKTCGKSECKKALASQVTKARHQNGVFA